MSEWLRDSSQTLRTTCSEDTLREMWIELEGGRPRRSRIERGGRRSGLLDVNDGAAQRVRDLRDDGAWLM